MVYNFIKTKRENNILRLTLARPAKRNAFTPTMVNEINHALILAEEDQNIYVVEIDAEGPVFCAGMDISTFEDPSKDSPNSSIENIDISLGEVFENLNKPTVCKVEGDVFAGGFLIILGCTYVLAQKEVKFSLPETEIGLFPFQVMGALLKHLPQNKALKLCIDSEPFDVAKAVDLGIVDSVLEKGKIEHLRDKLLSKSPLAIRQGIEALHLLHHTPREKRYAFLFEKLQELRLSSDAQEGIQAWREKRKPIWKNQ